MLIAEMEAIEPATAKALAGQGIETSEALLERAGPAAARAELAAATGLDPALLQALAQRADLMRIPKVVEGVTLLLEALDLGSRAKLATANAPDLLRALRRKNIELTAVRSIQPESVLAAWIEQAAHEPGRVEG
ncbi:MAG: DUF4332 domain-containing protein [Alphaproteobacteria bacterium]|nr:DUF4332 domain-containing protein [Alphaproteobacteria bacterium]